MAAGAEPTLAGDFPAATEDEWRASVDKVLKGGSFERLQSRTADDIVLDPLYTSGPDETTTGTPGSAPFTRGFRRAARAEGMWDVRAVIAGAGTQNDSIATSNATALRELERGATSLLLAGDALAEPATLAAVLDGVYLDLAAVVLQPGDRFLTTAEWLMELWIERGVADSDAVGGFGADPIATLAVTGTLSQGVERALADMAGLAAMTSRRYPGVRAVTVDATPWAEAGGSEAQELAAMLSTAVAYLRSMQAAGLGAHEAVGQIEIVLGADADFFTTIAKLRAARRVWAAMAAACGIDSAVAAPHLTVRSLERMMSRRDPWVNMLRVTSATAAAVMGGADSVISLPFDVEVGEPGELGRRMARNTQLLLGEESGVGRVVDPAGGSWYIETYTEQLATEAWDLFRVLEGAGGQPAVLLDGTLPARVAAVRDARVAQVATRRAPLTGVSEFPDIAEAPLTVSTTGTVPWPASTSVPDPAGSGTERLCEPLPRIRWAESFEALRDAADSAPSRPTVHLATLGPVAVHTARATFAKNFFEAGGIAAVVADGATGFAESGASLACICSSDDLYAEGAAALATELTAAGAARVYLAGRPGDHAEDWAAAGVDEYIGVGTDVLAVLRSAHELLGLATTEVTR